MKKTYIAPKAVAMNIEAESIICASVGLSNTPVPGNSALQSVTRDSDWEDFEK